MTDDSPAPTNPPRNLMLAIALAQGFALLLLWRALTNETWPEAQKISSRKFTIACQERRSASGL